MTRVGGYAFVTALVVFTTITGVPWFWCTLLLVAGACLVEALRAERERCLDCGTTLGIPDGRGGRGAEQDDGHQRQRDGQRGE